VVLPSESELLLELVESGGRDQYQDQNQDFVGMVNSWGFAAP